MPGDGDPVVYFLLHAPKAAGTTIEAHLQAHMPKDRLWMPLPPSIKSPLRWRRYRLDNLPRPQGVRAVTGHWIGRSLERHFPNREIRRALLLRDPVGFQVSFYNHRMMLALSRGQRTCDFDRHLRAMPRDLLATFLLWQWLELPASTMLATSDEQKYELLNKALAGFWFVGGHQDCDRLIREIAADLDVPPAAPPKNTSLYWRSRVDWQPVNADELPAATRDAILSRNPIHEALWHSWRGAGFEPARVRPRRLIRSGNRELGLRELARAAFFARFIAVGEFLADPIWQSAARASSVRQWRRAVMLYRKALQRVPGFPEVWLQYGHALKETGDIVGAEEAYRRALELDEEMGETHLSLGDALRLQGRSDEAREAYRRFQQLDPAALERKRGELVALGWPEEAVSSFWHSLTGNPGSE